jgi:hypothetical protein
MDEVRAERGVSSAVARLLRVFEREIRDDSLARARPA